MNELEYTTDEPIAALATGWEESALAVIRTSGTSVIEMTAKVFSASDKLASAEGNMVVYGYIIDPQTGKKADQVLISVFRAPHSFTGEDSAEISCHGGIPAISAILDILRRNGFRDAAPGEFTMRAFVNGKLDLTKAEAVHEIVTAKTIRAHNLAVNRLAGMLEARINSFKKNIVDMLSSVELLLDYPEDELDGQIAEYPLKPEDITAIRAEIDRLADSYSVGKVYREGVPVALAGRTNAGKSSLFNLLLKEDRAIVSEIHGTTRDYIESWITIDGIPMRVYDTAGLRDSDNPIEAEGIRRSGRVIEGSAIVVYLVDSVSGISNEDRTRIESFEKDRKTIKIWSRTDLAGKGESGNSVPDGFIALSSVTGEGFPELEKALLNAACGSRSFDGDTVVDSQRQYDLLVKASASLGKAVETAEGRMPLDIAAMELRASLDALGEITGEVSSVDILNNMFSNFCVGK